MLAPYGTWKIPHLSGGDGAEDVDDAVGLLLAFLRVLFPEETAAARKKDALLSQEVKAGPHVTGYLDSKRPVNYSDPSRLRRFGLAQKITSPPPFFPGCPLARTSRHISFTSICSPFKERDNKAYVTNHNAHLMKCLLLPVTLIYNH